MREGQRLPVNVVWYVGDTIDNYRTLLNIPFSKHDPSWQPMSIFTRCPLLSVWKYVHGNEIIEIVLYLRLECIQALVCPRHHV